MTSVSLIDGASPMTADAIVVATVSTGTGVALADGSAGIDAALDGTLLPALRVVEATGRADEASRSRPWARSPPRWWWPPASVPASPTPSTPKPSGVRWERRCAGWSRPAG